MVFRAVLGLHDPYLEQLLAIHYASILDRLVFVLGTSIIISSRRVGGADIFLLNSGFESTSTQSGFALYLYIATTPHGPIEVRYACRPMTIFIFLLISLMLWESSSVRSFACLQPAILTHLLWISQEPTLQLICLHNLMESQEPVPDLERDWHLSWWELQLFHFLFRNVLELRLELLDILVQDFQRTITFQDQIKCNYGDS